MTKSPTILYLQGGPGLNTAVERVWFQERLPVLWWDQPRFAADTPAAFEAMLEAASARLTEMCSLRQTPIDIVAWSFGARLALELAHRHPERIATLTLLAPTFCLETAFLRLARYFVRHDIGGMPLQAAIAAFDATGSHDAFLRLVMELLAIPDLLGRYWAPGAEILYTRHQAEAAKTEWFDLPTLIAISRDLFTRQLPERALIGIDRLRILVGRHDVFFDPESDIEHWKRLLPQASIQIVDSGHMVPFEIPAAEWLSSAHSVSF